MKNNILIIQPQSLTHLQVPRIGLFSEEAQLHGAIIVSLKQKWPCDLHQGENGDSGFCFVGPDGSHIGLNHRKLKIWAAAIVRSVLFLFITILTKN